MGPITFIAQPPSLLLTTRRNSICQPNQLSTCCQQRSARVLSMKVPSEGRDRNLSLDTSRVSESQGAPEFVDIDDGDIEAEDIDMMDALGSDFEVYKEKRKKVRQRTRSFVDEISVSPDSVLTSDAARQPPIEEDEITEYVRTAVKAADLRKAENIVALRISKLTYISSFIIMATGNNPPQIRAIGNLVEEYLAKQHGLHTRRKDGTAGCGWLLLDYGDILVNIFTPELRKKYNLEGLWKDGEEVDISDCIVGAEGPIEDEPNLSLDNWLDE